MGKAVGVEDSKETAPPVEQGQGPFSDHKEKLFSTNVITVLAGLRPLSAHQGP